MSDSDKSFDHSKLTRKFWSQWGGPCVCEHCVLLPDYEPNPNNVVRFVNGKWVPAEPAKATWEMGFRERLKALWSAITESD